MNLCIVAVLVIGVVVSTEGCCTPEKWEGRVGELGAVVPGGKPHEVDRRRPHPHPRPHPKIFGMEIAMGYDAEEEKIAVLTPTREGRMKHISNFRTEKAYVVLNTTCKYFSMTKKFQKFCTEGGTKEGSTTLGGSLLVDTYRFKLKEMEGSAAVTSDSCIPVGEIWFGKMKRDDFIMNVGFFNVTEGIRDPDMFKHPESCEPETGDMDSYLERIGVSPIARYFTVNKFVGEPPQTVSGSYSKNDVY